MGYFSAFVPNVPKVVPQQKRPPVNTEGLLCVEVSGGVEPPYTVLQTAA